MPGEWEAGRERDGRALTPTHPPKGWVGGWWEGESKSARAKEGEGAGVSVSVRDRLRKRRRERECGRAVGRDTDQLWSRRWRARRASTRTCAATECFDGFGRRHTGCVDLA